MKRLLPLLFAVGACLALPWLGTSCQPEGYISEADVSLRFSTDTVAFDTVFTAYSTPVVRVTVYNPASRSVRLSSVTLAGGQESRFRLNVDGDTSLIARNVELMAGDSLFIFIQANINPNDRREPFLIEDAILFSNGQRLPLTAWGRNAVYHRAEEGRWVHVIDCDHWDHSLPHVILGNAAIDSTFTLTLRPGEELHFADGAVLYVWTGATLEVQGTADEPVLFGSLRHDGWYSYLPGQWQCVLFRPGSTGRIDHAVVENGTGGLRAMQGASLRLSNTVVRHMSDAALIGQGSTIEGRNLLVYDCLASLMVLGGGSYAFEGCTFADYWRYSPRSIESIVLSNYYLDADRNVVGGDLRLAAFRRCIVYGTYSSGEVLLSADEGFAFAEPQFEASIVKGGEWDEDPLFVDPSQHNYRLQEGSPAEGIGYTFDN